MDAVQKLRPYTMKDQPTSDGRAFLGHAFAFFCAIEWGFSPLEIEVALEGKPAFEPDGVRERVLLAAREIGKVFLRGEVETFARPFGGGTPIKLAKTAWELDDFTWRFAKSAVDPKALFDAEAPCTHWLFVDAAQFDVILGRSQPELPVAAPAAPVPEQSEASPPALGIGSDRFLRIPEVLALVGMSKSTMYDRMKAGRFPRNIELGGNLVVWREADVRVWMSSQGQRPRHDPSS